MALQYLDTIIAFVVILLGVSLLITTLNQMISALLGYRGTNLRWALETLLNTADSGLKDKSKELVTKLLQKPIISDSVFSKFMKKNPLLEWISKRWRLASAISPDELIHGLRKMADELQITDKPTADLILELLDAPNPELQKKVAMLQETLKGLDAKYSLVVDNLVQQLGALAQTAVGKMEAWFNMIMKRASQRFALQMRLWTVAFAFLIAFGTHMDSFQIVQKLWTSPGLRSGLVSQREVILGEAAVVLSSQKGAPTGVSGLPPQILVDAMNKFISTEKVDAAGLGTVPTFNSLEGAVQWLREGLKVDERRKEALIREYHDLVIAELAGRAEGIRKELEKAGFKLQLLAWNELCHYNGLSNILGILMSAAFLSLGAPFWFNTLKNLSNLRTLVAPRQEEKQ